MSDFDLPPIPVYTDKIAVTIYGDKDKRIAELEAHIRAIAEHHVTAIGEILGTHYHTDRRNFALKALEKP